VLTRTGFEDAIIHIRDNVEPYLHTSYWIQVLRGFLLGLLVYVGAPFVAQFFGEPQVTPIIRVLAVVQVLRGIRSIGVVVLRREMNFRDESFFQATGVLTNFLVTVGLGVLYRDVWALVWGQVAAETVLAIASFWFHSYRPRFTFDKEKAVELFQYGVWLLGAGIVSYIALQADNIVAGRWVGASALGVYQMGYLVSNLPAKEVAKQLSKVVQSGYAEIQQDKQRLRTVYQKTLLTVWAIVLPATVGMMITADVFVPVLLGDKWLDIVPILPILALGALFRAIGSSIGALFKATGHTSFVFRVEALRAVTLLIGLVLVVTFQADLISIAWAFAASTVVMISVSLFLVSKTVGGVYSLLRNALPSLGAVTVMVAAVYGLSIAYAEGVVYLRLVALVGMGATVYISAHALIERWASFRPIRLVYHTVRERL
jgi:O-antigen/teichoic acid export membrane protein